MDKSVFLFFQCTQLNHLLEERQSIQNLFEKTVWTAQEKY